MNGRWGARCGGVGTGNGRGEPRFGSLGAGGGRGAGAGSCPAGTGPGGSIPGDGERRSPVRGSSSSAARSRVRVSPTPLPPPRWPVAPGWSWGRIRPPGGGGGAGGQRGGGRRLPRRPERKGSRDGGSVVPGSFRGDGGVGGGFWGAPRIAGSWDAGGWRGRGLGAPAACRQVDPRGSWGGRTPRPLGLCVSPTSSAVAPLATVVAGTRGPGGEPTRAGREHPWDAGAVS